MLPVPRVLQLPKIRNSSSVPQKSFLCPSFNPFYLLKCVLGAGENELESVQFLAFLSMAITEDPQRQSRKVKQTKRSVLAVLYEIIVPPLHPFYFYCFAFCFLAVSMHTFTCLLSSQLPSLHFLSPLPFAAHPLILDSSASILVLSDKLVKWYGAQRMEE